MTASRVGTALSHSKPLTHPHPGWPRADGAVGLPQALRVCFIPRGAHDLCPWKQMFHLLTLAMMPLTCLLRLSEPDPDVLLLFLPREGALDVHLY